MVSAGDGRKQYLVFLNKYEAQVGCYVLPINDIYPFKQVCNYTIYDKELCFKKDGWIYINKKFYIKEEDALIVSAKDENEALMTSIVTKYDYIDCGYFTEYVCLRRNACPVYDVCDRVLRYMDANCIIKAIAENGNTVKTKIGYINTKDVMFIKASNFKQAVFYYKKWLLGVNGKYYVEPKRTIESPVRGLDNEDELTMLATEEATLSDVCTEDINDI